MASDWKYDGGLYLPPGAVFSDTAADRAVSFIQCLPHTLGEYAGRPFMLHDWQRDDIVRPLFGTLRPDGQRMYRTAYIEIPRKNGKSTLGAGLALYLLFADNEPGAQVYGAAHDKMQASIVFDEAKRMVLRTPALLKRSKPIDSVKRIVVPGTESFYRAIPADDASSHGFNASGIMFDELHTQTGRALWDVLTTSTGARRQPLTVAITTAGHDRNSICWEQHVVAIALLKLRGIIPQDWYRDIPAATVDDPTFFAYVRSIPEDWDWQDEDNWRIANPAIKSGFRSLDETRMMARRAAQSPSLQNTFRNLYLNQWTAQETRWLDMGAWDRCNAPVDPDELAGMLCYGGLDLAATTDLAAFVLCFPPETPHGQYRLLPHFWMPAENIEDRAKADRVPYTQWAAEGLITLTPGRTINYDSILSYIERAAHTYNLREIGFDPWGAYEISNKLDQFDGLAVVQIRQNFQNMSAPTKDMERLVLDMRVAHGGHAVLRWNADNVVVVTDENGNVRPSKRKSKQRIDGIPAAIMALDRAQRQGSGDSVYENRGLRTIG